LQFESRYAEPHGTSVRGNPLENKEGIGAKYYENFQLFAIPRRSQGGAEEWKNQRKQTWMLGIERAA